MNKDIDIDEDQKTASFVQLKNDRNTLKNKDFDLTCVSNIVYAVGNNILTSFFYFKDILSIRIKV